jgi:hypothetical protein
MQPTPHPTDYPTYKPVTKPEATPISYLMYKPKPAPDCKDEVYTEFNCYGKGEAIDVYFDQCHPEPYDWIGIHPVYVDGDELKKETGPWKFLCGSQHCHKFIQDGSVIFKDDTTGPWPLTKDLTKPS